MRNIELHEASLQRQHLLYSNRRVQYSRPSFEKSKGYRSNSPLSSSSILPPKNKGKGSKGATYDPAVRGKGIVVKLPGKGKGGHATNTTAKGKGGPPSPTPSAKSKGIPPSYRSRPKSTTHFVREKVESCQEICFPTDPQLSHENNYISKKSAGKGKGSDSTKISRNGKKRNDNEMNRRRMSKGKGYIHHDNPNPIDACCQGGVSFLKLTFIGQTSGNLSLNPHNACESEQSDRSKAIGGKSGKERHLLHHSVVESDVRFVDCNDPCTDPSTGMKCNEWAVVEYVYDGKVVCFGSWDSEYDIIAFDKKLPKHVDLLFEAEMDSLFATIHTSCSQPIYPPYGVELSPDCKQQQPFHLANRKISTTTLAFEDGISTDFYNGSRNDNNKMQFYYNFATCRCICQLEQSVPSPPPTLLLSPIPSPTPTTGSVTESPSFDANHCNDLCVAWVSENCVIPSDELSPEQACIPSDLVGRQLETDRNQNKNFQSRQLTISYHEKMVAAYRRLLAALYSV